MSLCGFVCICVYVCVCVSAKPTEQPLCLACYPAPAEAPGASSCTHCDTGAPPWKTAWRLKHRQIVQSHRLVWQTRVWCNARLPGNRPEPNGTAQRLTSLVKYNFMTDDSSAERRAHHQYLAGAYHLLVFFNEACSLPSGAHNRPIDMDA